MHGDGSFPNGSTDTDVIPDMIVDDISVGGKTKAERFDIFWQRRASSLVEANVAGSPRPRTAFYFYTRFQLTHDATTPTLLATLLPILLSSHTPSEIRPVFRSVPPAMHCSQQKRH